MRHIVLYSGGPDSLITAAYVRHTFQRDKITMVYFDLGHRYAERELKSIQSTYPDTLVDTTLKGMGQVECEDAFVPGRNALLVVRAATYADESEVGIWLSVQKDELSIPDRTPEFLVQIGNVVSLLEGKTIWVSSPWLEVDKAGMVQWYVSHNGLLRDLLATWSCYTPKVGDQVQCGECPACLRRYIAFDQARIVESYRVDPGRSQVAHEYRQRAKQGVYSPERCKQILRVLGAD